MIAIMSEDDEALARAVWIMSSRTATAIALLRGTAARRGSLGIAARGGNLLGIPVYTSGACYASGSPGEAFIVLLDPRSVLLADPGIVEIRRTPQGDVEMSDTPTGGATQLHSAWQNNLLAVVAERWVSWQRTSDNGVIVLTNVTY